MMKPLCFVLMPFGRKRDERGREVDFDAIYRTLIAPAVVAAEMEPIRADEEQVGGSIHKPMYERLMLCEYAVADVTSANPNVYYELGIRHALRPRSTVILFASGTVLPFDVAPLRGLPYRITGAGVPAQAEEDSRTIATRLKAARQDHNDDSPLFQLIEGVPRVEIDHEKTDLFRARTVYAKEYKDRLHAARATNSPESVKAIADDPALSNLLDVETGIVIDLYLSLRDVKAYQEMVDLYARMPPPLQRTRMVREQLGFALNRLRRGAEAEKVLRQVIDEFGESSETNGLLGRVYKDRRREALDAGRTMEARGFLKQAIAAYLAGFEADWRDFYPGVNALSLMDMLDKPDPRMDELMVLVRYAALRRAARSGDYWTYATLLELAVLARDPDAAMEAAEAATAAARAGALVGWEFETTAQQLDNICESRIARGEDVSWVKDIAAQFRAIAARPAPKPH